MRVSFSDLRARLASAGTVNLERDYIMAQVISEPGNPNLETNPHTAWNQCDLTESARTAYVQSIDGAYGLRVKLADIADMSALPRYATVKIALAGLTLEREDTPARYTLRGFSASNILEMTGRNRLFASLPKNAISANLSTMISIHSSHLKTWRYRSATARGEIFITDILTFPT